MSHIESIHHIAVVVENVDKAIAFYDAVFGLPHIKRLTARVSQNRGAWYQAGALEFHLQERPEGSTVKTEQHFAVLTKDFDGLCNRIVENGGRLEEGKLIEGFTRRGFAYDLDGNRIELLQR